MILEDLTITSEVPTAPPLLTTVLSSIQADSYPDIFVLKSDQISLLDSTTGLYSALTASESGSGDGQLSGSTAISLGADGLLYVLDFGNRRIEGFTTSGAYARQFPLEAG